VRYFFWYVAATNISPLGIHSIARSSRDNIERSSYFDCLAATPPSATPAGAAASSPDIQMSSRRST
jgi:hypothetical protein